MQPLLSTLRKRRRLPHYHHPSTPVSKTRMNLGVEWRSYIDILTLLNVATEERNTVCSVIAPALVEESLAFPLHNPTAQDSGANAQCLLISHALSRHRIASHRIVWVPPHQVNLDGVPVAVLYNKSDLPGAVPEEKLEAMVSDSSDLGLCCRCLSPDLVRVSARITSRSAPSRTLVGALAFIAGG